MKIGDKVKGFSFKSDENVSYWNFMERFIGQVGTITEILPDSVGVDFGYKDVNENVLLVHYSIAEAKNHLVEPDYEQYIGRKIIGFKFEDYKGVSFTKGKASMIGSVGTITAVFDCHGCECFDVSFGVGIVYAYPCELAIEHIVNEENTFTYYKQYIGRKMIGFKFNHSKNAAFTPIMNQLIDKCGVIIAVRENPFLSGGFLFVVDFKDAEVVLIPTWADTKWSYPCEIAIHHIVNEETVPTNQSSKTEPDMVNHPAHYGSGVYEVVEVLEAWGFEKEAHLTQAIQYIARYDKKGEPIQDLKKAIFWIQRKIMLLEKAGKK